jgi:hypothetical protein
MFRAAGVALTYEHPVTLEIDEPHIRGSPT